MDIIVVGIRMRFVPDEKELSAFVIKTIRQRVGSNGTGGKKKGPKIW
jgi:hypothetical protein